MCVALAAATVACGPTSISGAPLVPTLADAASPVDQAAVNLHDGATNYAETGSLDAGIPDAGTLAATTVDVGSPDTTITNAATLDAGDDVDTGTDGAGITGSDVMYILVDAPPPGASLPAFTPAVLARIAVLRATGRGLGMQGAAFAKIGDSITESGSTLFDCGMGFGTLGSYSSLQATINYFSTVTWPDPDPESGETNSFDRHSLCAMGGWDSSQTITDYMGESSPRLVQEILAIHPAWAFVEVGTNDVLELGDVWGTGVAHPEATFENNLMIIVSMIEAEGVVPVLYTLPPLLPLAVVGDTDPAAVQAAVLTLNNVIRGIAAADSIPLIDFWVALMALPSPYGIDPTDGIHPMAYNDADACNFTSPALSDGYNVRNLLTLQMLARLQSM